jgi:hypothetical protein
MIYFLNVYITLIHSSNGPGDISSCPLLLRITTMSITRVFWCHFLPPNFCGWPPHKSSHPFSLPLSPLGSCHVSKVQQSSHAQGGCIVWIIISASTEPSNHTRGPSPRVLQVPLLFGRHPFYHTPKF